MIVNTLINAAKSKKVESVQNVYQDCSPPKQWFEFADDTAILTTLEKDNQLLCNVFIK